MLYIVNPIPGTIEEQPRHTALGAKTLRAAGFRSATGVGSAVTARNAAAPALPPWPQPSPLATTSQAIFRHALKASAFAWILTACLLAQRLPGANLTWDANGGTSPNPSDGNGIWNAVNDWWNGSANVNGTWSGTTPDSATFGAGTAGNYQIGLAGGTIVASNVTFATSGYTLTNGTLSLIGVAPQITLNPNVTSTINCSVSVPALAVNSGGFLNLGGGSTACFSGTSLGTGTVMVASAAAKTYATTGNPIWNVGDPVAAGGGLVVSNNSTLTSGGSFQVGVSGGSGMMTINSSSAAVNINGSLSTLHLGRNGGVSKGRLMLLNGVINTATSPNGVRVGYSLNNAASSSELDILGGVLLQGTPLLILESSTLATAKVVMSGGTAILSGIEFGAGSTSGTASFTQSGGLLYLSGAMTNRGTGGFAAEVTLSGGTNAAAAPWNSAMPMTLANVNGNITFQAADTNGNPQDITLNGPLSGSGGGLTKSGAGTLTLAATNTYTGNTVVNAGTLATTTASTGAGAYYTATNASLDVTVTAPGSSLIMSSLTLNAGSALNLELNSFGNPAAAPVTVSGTLNATSTVTINLSGNGLTAGQFPLIKYGALGGTGFNAFQLGNLAGAAALINNPVNQSIDLSISLLTWNGTVNGNWDIGATPNWKGGGFYTETNGNGPSVIFNDSAAGTANITLNGLVSPSSILVSNTMLAYSLSGAGRVTGDASLLKQGTNALLVTTTNDFVSRFGNYTVTINAGILQLGDGVGANGSLAGDIDDEAILAVANPGDLWMSNNIAGAGQLIKTGAGKLTLTGANSYNRGTTINGGTLALGTMNNASMAYTNNGATLYVTAMGTTPLPVSTLNLGTGSKLTFDLAYTVAPPSSTLAVSGNVMMNGNVTVNVTNAAPIGTNVLLSYTGTRTGTGSFAPGTLPPGASLVDDPVNKKVSLVLQPRLRVIIPALNTNEIVVAAATPQDYGAKGDGISDDSAAFQNAINAVAGSAAKGGGVLFVPAGFYAFYTNILVPSGVTLHGDWKDWTKTGGGLVGTTFKVYFGAGQITNMPFLLLYYSASLRDLNIWYPTQDPNNIVSYPFTIAPGSDSVIQNVALVNSYQGIAATVTPSLIPVNTYSQRHIFSTVIGTPLAMGMSLDGIYDDSIAHDIRFSPDIWAQSGLSNAPATGGACAAWMRKNGEAIQLRRFDGEMADEFNISGYNIGLEASGSPYINGATTAEFYNCVISNCGTAFLAEGMSGFSGVGATRCVFDGDIGVLHDNASSATALFHTCDIIGRQGTAVDLVGSNNFADGWSSWMQFQNCTISNTVFINSAVANFVGCHFLGATNCVLNANGWRAGFTGCTFSPATNIINNGGAHNVQIDSRASQSNALPLVNWTNILNDFATRRPARTNLYVVTAYGAVGDGTNDDTAAIQRALNAASAGGGGLVYLPGGKYKLTDTVDIPGGVELRGTFEMRHGVQPSGASTGVPGSVLQPYGGEGTTNGPVAIALEANAGLVGVTISYEDQSTNFVLFPATIQGRGRNIYAIGVQCPIAYTFVDLDTYASTNHFFYMVDGWALLNGWNIGGGSQGSVVDCQGDPGYWPNNAGSKNKLDVVNALPVARGFTAQNLRWDIFGDCHELYYNGFNDGEYQFNVFNAENGRGPEVTEIGCSYDGTIQGYILNAPVPCAINVVNNCYDNATFPAYSTDTNDCVGLISATNFQGTARFFTAALFAQPYWDYIVNGGDVGLELVHLGVHSQYASQVNGGVFHLVNTLSEISWVSTNHYPPYIVTFGPNAGVAGKVSEIIGNAAYNGYSVINLNSNNPVNLWNDYAISSSTVLARTNVYQPFQPSIPPLALINQMSPGLPALSLQWTNGAGFYTLYGADSLTPPINWEPVGITPALVNGSWNVVVPGTNNSGFYRLGAVGN